MEAIRANDGTRIEALLEEGLDVDVNLKLGGSAINFIASTGNYELIAVVIAAGCDLEAQRSGAGRTALHTAAENGDLELISALVENAANLERAPTRRKTRRSSMPSTTVRSRRRGC